MAGETIITVTSIVGRTGRVSAYVAALAGHGRADRLWRAGAVFGRC